ncbi:MAG: methyl-accepting chemotaxis protein [Balneola sp.]
MLFILGSTIIIYLGTLTAISLNLRKSYLKEGEELANTRVLQMANNIKSKMNEDLSIARSMATIITEYLELPENDRVDAQRRVFNSIMRDHPNYEAAWMSWELGAIDPTWGGLNGRRRFTLFKKDGRLTEVTEIIDTDAQNPTGDYYRIRSNPNFEMSEPYISDEYIDGVTNTLWITSPCVPLYKEGKFAGLLGTDYSVENYVELSQIDKIYGRGYSFISSNGGALVSHSSEKTTKESTLKSLSFFDNSETNINLMIKNGESNSFTVYDEKFNETVYVTFASVLPSESILPWSVGMVIPISELTAPYSGSINLTIILGIIGLVILSLVIYRVSNTISKPIEKTNHLLKSISEGNIVSEKLENNGIGEISEMTRSLNNLIEDLHVKAELSAEIGKGNLEAEYELKNENDVLGKSLLKMKSNLLAVISETEEVVAQASFKGNLSARIDLEGKEGAWKDLSMAINGLLSSFSKPLISLNKIIDSMATGDLTQRYTEVSDGDIKVMTDNLNIALDTLNNLFLQIASSSNIIEESSKDMSSFTQELSTNTNQISSAIAEMSSGANTQVSKVDESSNLVEGILASANEMETRANRIHKTAKTGAENSEKGMSMMNNVVESIRDIAKFSDKTTASMSVLTDRSSEIERVLGVITEIAAQTNLLALNAAIEAAQAGDAGRGFAVVAEEVRKLAEDSKKSASEIERLIFSAQNDTNDASRVISEMNKSVKTGEETASLASKTFNQILESSNETLSFSEDILKAAHAQINNISEVVSITEGIVVIAEETAAGTEEVASSATEMSAGMMNYNQKTQSLVDIAISLRDSLSLVRILKVNHSEENLNEADQKDTEN